MWHFIKSLFRKERYILSFDFNGMPESKQGYLDVTGLITNKYWSLPSVGRFASWEVDSIMRKYMIRYGAKNAVLNKVEKGAITLIKEYSVK